MQWLINGSLVYDQCTSWMVSMPFCYYRHQTDKITSLLSFPLSSPVSSGQWTSMIIWFRRVKYSLTLVQRINNGATTLYLMVTQKYGFLLLFTLSDGSSIVEDTKKNFWKKKYILNGKKTKFNKFFIELLETLILRLNLFVQYRVYHKSRVTSTKFQKTNSENSFFLNPINKV